MSALVDITVPEDQDGTEAIVERWLFRVGDRVRIHEPLLELNTDKAMVEVPAPATGILCEILKHPSDSISPGEVLGRIEASAETSAVVPLKPNVKSAREPKSPAATTVAREAELSPAVRQLIKKHNIDVSRISGTGRGGRVTHDDVQNYLKNEASPSATVAASRKVPHSSTRRRIADHMVQSMLKTAPHVTAVFDADLIAVLAHRSQHRREFEKKSIHLTYTAYFVAAAAKALQAVPEINSRWHDDGLELFSDCNIGVAAATDSGLVVPVVHRANELDLLGIATRLQDLTTRARSGKLTPNDMRGGTFTITNHGVSGSLIATPIINQPQSAILGIGKVEKRAIVDETGGSEALRIKPMAYVTLTIDHRALDGYQANAFLDQFVKALTQWPAIE